MEDAELAVPCAKVGVKGADAATCTEVGVEDADAVLEDGGGATPFMRSRSSFIRRNFSSILDIEAQRSPISTMARFDLGEKIGGFEWNKALITNCYGPG